MEAKPRSTSVCAQALGRLLYILFEPLRKVSGEVHSSFDKKPSGFKKKKIDLFLSFQKHFPMDQWETQTQESMWFLSLFFCGLTSVHLLISGNTSHRKTWHAFGAEVNQLCTAVI